MHNPQIANPAPRRCALLLALALIGGCASNGGGDSGNNGDDGMPPDDPPVGPGPATVIHDLEVRRQQLAPLTTAEADRILDDASRVLQTVDRDGDVAADVLLARIGPLTSFASPDGFINSSGDFRAHCGIGGQIFVVNEINWCGRIGSNIIGCADRPGRCLMVVRIEPLNEGILWAHEFGHNAGLDHRSAPFALMAPTLAPVNRVINAAERNAFLNYSLLPPAGLLPAEREYMAQTTGRGGDPLPPVTEYVRQTFVRGVPFAEASRYTPADAETLLALLDNSDYRPFRANMISTIAAIGAPEHLDEVIRFFESGNGRLSREEYAARRAALFGLAYFAHRGVNGMAMDYLVASLDPAVWARRDLDWSLPYELSEARQWALLSQVAVLATALSGTAEAREALLALQARKDTARVQALGDDLLDQALEEHDRVSSMGLADYSAQDTP